MGMEQNQSNDLNKTLAGVCGLYCGACNLFIATMEDPARLKKLSARWQFPEDEMKCGGCRSDTRGPYCRRCKMSACAAEKGIDFCMECEEYPCDDLKQFQSERPHRIELWDDLQRIETVGHRQWLKEIREHYTCMDCGTVNSAYDLKCRRCGKEPSCGYVAEHRQAVEQYLKNR